MFFTFVFIHSLTHSNVHNIRDDRQTKRHHILYKIKFKNDYDNHKYLNKLSITSRSTLQMAYIHIY